MAAKGYIIDNGRLPDTSASWVCLECWSFLGADELLVYLALQESPNR